MKTAFIALSMLALSGCAVVGAGEPIYPASVTIPIPTIVLPAAPIAVAPMTVGGYSHYDDGNYWPHRPYDNEEWVCDRYHERCWKAH